MTKKVYNIVILIVVILVLSATAVICALPGRKMNETTTPDVTNIISNKDPLSNVLNNGERELALKTVETKYGLNKAIVSYSTGISSGAYCKANLKETDLYEYKTYSIEFDILTPRDYSSIYGNVSLYFQRKGNTHDYVQEESTIRLENINDRNFTLNIGDFSTNSKDEFHVEYRLNINKYNMTKSTLSIYVDGVLAYDSAEHGEAIFHADTCYLSSMKIRDLYGNEGEGAVVIANLKVKGVNR